MSKKGLECLSVVQDSNKVEDNPKAEELVTCGKPVNTTNSGNSGASAEDFVSKAKVKEAIKVWKERNC